MQLLRNILRAFADGFLPMMTLLLLLGGGWYYHQFGLGKWAEEIPVIHQLSDTYKQGWIKARDLPKSLGGRLLSIEESTTLYHTRAHEVENNRQGTAGAQLKIPIIWQRERIEKELRKKGWSKKKIKAANACLSYIDKYQEAALIDMYYTGISASITIAQGILESNAGRSKLARTTNNHFGIKARPSKQARLMIRQKRYTSLTDADFLYRSPAIGVSQHHDDNKYDRFEVYPSVLESFQRHSDLLQNNCSKARKGCYGWIWDTFPVQEQYVDLSPAARQYESVSGYAPEDFFGTTSVPYYAAQAAGLKMAGYATSKTYHQKLAYLIDTYQLWWLDLAVVKRGNMRQK